MDFLPTILAGEGVVAPLLVQMFRDPLIRISRKHILGPPVNAGVHLMAPLVEAPLISREVDPRDSVKVALDPPNITNPQSVNPQASREVWNAAGPLSSEEKDPLNSVISEGFRLRAPRSASNLWAPRSASNLWAPLSRSPPNTKKFVSLWAPLSS